MPADSVVQVAWPAVSVKFAVVQGTSSDHSGLNFSVIVTPACSADTETEILVACGTPECDTCGMWNTRM